MGAWTGGRGSPLRLARRLDVLVLGIQRHVAGQRGFSRPAHERAHCGLAGVPATGRANTEWSLQLARERGDMLSARSPSVLASAAAQRLQYLPAHLFEILRRVRTEDPARIRGKMGARVAIHQEYVV